jgi:ketosteroid isomerase-like protein
MTPLDTYYRALDGGDLEGTLACFTDDAVYVRPALDGSGLEFIRGRDDLRAFFVERGKKEWRHVLRACAVDGSRCLAEGVAGIDGEAPSHTFLVHATIADDGRISRYFALMSEAPPDWESYL